MGLESDILKGKYFPAHSRERLKAIMATAFILLIVPFMLVDAYGSFLLGYSTIATLEVALMVVLLIAYFLFPEQITLDQITHASLSILILLTILSVFLLGEDPELVIFSMTILPIFIFFFLGIEDGVKVSIGIFVFFLLVALGAIFGYIAPILHDSLLLKMTVAYAAVSFLLYVIERERDADNNNLSTALKGKDILFKEVHHRTKNNMQVMMGLLETQSFRVQDPHYKKLFQSHVERIKAMSLVHENLYSDNDHEKVDMHKYLTDLISGLQKFTSNTIMVDIEYVSLDMSSAMSIGLLVNEAVSNAIEHAYSVSGQIDVSLRHKDKGYLLSIQDFGLGFNTEKEFESLGLTLVDDLSSSLPNGKLNIIVNGGTEIRIYFEKEKQ